MRPIAGRSASAFLALSTSAALLFLGGVQAQGVSSSDGIDSGTHSEVTLGDSATPTEPAAPAQPGDADTPAEDSPAADEAADGTQGSSADGSAAAHSDSGDAPAADDASGADASDTGESGADAPTSDAPASMPEQPAAPAPRSGSPFRAASSGPIDFANPNDPRLFSNGVPNHILTALGGEGTYGKEIAWLQWPNGDLIDEVGRQSSVPKSLTRHNFIDVTPQVRLVTSCTIDNLVYQNRPGRMNAQGQLAPFGPVVSYVPGDWQGDFLDNLYNSGAIGRTPGNRKTNGNTMRIGIATKKPDGFYGTPTFDLSCHAQILTRSQPNGQRFETSLPFPIDGLVLSDAESAQPNEFVRATTTQQAQWYVLDRIWDHTACPGRPSRYYPTVEASLNAPPGTSNQTTNATYATIDGNTITIQPNGTECTRSAKGTPGAVLFAKGISSAKIALQGNGGQAVALGIFIPRDLGDAPRSYGEAVALYHPTWQNPLTESVTNLTRGATLAEAAAPREVLGSRIDHNHKEVYSPLADLDQHDDALADNDKTLDVVPGGTVSRTITCGGNGVVAGWVDWNLNGTFDDVEKSQMPTGQEVRCNGTSATLTWNVPVSVLRAVASETFNPEQSIMRLRTAAPGTRLEPTGVTLSGEVEDHGIQLVVPRLTLVNRVDTNNPYTPTDPNYRVPKATDWKVKAIYKAPPGGQNQEFSAVETFKKTVPSGNFSISVEPVSATPIPGYTTDGWACEKTPGSNHPTGQTYASTFTLNENKTTGELRIPQADHVTCTIIHRPVPGTISWQKVDPQDNLLSGSEWSLSGASATPARVVKDCVAQRANQCDTRFHDVDPAKGKLKVTGLRWGSYTLTETRAPAGYVLNTAATTHNVIGEMDAGKFVNEMHKPLVIPLTGGTASIFYVLAGGGLTVVAIAGAAAIGNRGRSRG